MTRMERLVILWFAVGLVSGVLGSLVGHAALRTQEGAYQDGYLQAVYDAGYADGKNNQE